MMCGPAAAVLAATYSTSRVTRDASPHAEYTAETTADRQTQAVLCAGL